MPDLCASDLYVGMHVRGIRFAMSMQANAPRPASLWERLARNLNPVRAGYVCEGAVVRSVTYAERSAGSSYAREAAISGVNYECWASHAAGSRRDMPAGAPRPEGYASGGSPPGGKCPRGLRAWLDFLRFFCYNNSELHTPAAG